MHTAQGNGDVILTNGQVLDTTDEDDGSDDGTPADGCPDAGDGTDSTGPPPPELGESIHHGKAIFETGSGSTLCELENDLRRAVIVVEKEIRLELE